MKISLERRLLLNVLGTLLPHKGKISQILGCVLVETEDDSTVKFTTGDGVTCVVIMVDATVDSPGCIAVPLGMFNALVSGFPDGLVEIGVAKDVATVKSGEFSAKIKLLDPDDYPNSISVTGEEIEVPCADLTTAIHSVLYAASQTQTGSYTSAVHFAANGNIMLEACDGSKLGRSFLPNDGEVSAETLIPSQSLEKMLSTILRAEGVGKVKITISEDYLLFSLDGREMRVSARTVARNDVYPDLNRAIPVTPKFTADVTHIDLITALDVALSVNNENDILRVKLILDDRGLTVRAPSGQAGEATSTISASMVDGGTGEMFVNGKFLRQVIERLGDKVQIGFSGPLRPLKVTDGSGAIHIVMPMQ